MVLDTAESVMLEASDDEWGRIWVSRRELAEYLQELIDAGKVSRRALADRAELSTKAVRNILGDTDKSPFVPFDTACRLMSAARRADDISLLTVFGNA